MRRSSLRLKLPRVLSATDPVSCHAAGLTVCHLNRVTRTLNEHYTRVFRLVELEPTPGLEPRTYRLQDSFSSLTMAATSDFNVYCDHSSGHSGTVGREFVSQLVSRRAQ